MRFIHVLVGCLAVSLGVSLTAQDPSKITIRTTKVLDGLFVLSGGGANVGVSVGEDGVLLVDAKAAVAVDKLKAALAAIDPRPPRIVLDSNWHFDHADGNEAMAAMGATVIAHPNSRPHMLAEQRISEADPAIVVPPYKRGALPVVTLDEPAVIYFNGEEIAVIHVPAAHSDGDLAYYFRKANVLFTGDLFFPAGDFFIHYGGGGTSAGMVRAADRFLALVNDETRIVPGHGPVCKPADLVAAKAFMVAVRDRIQALIAKGQTAEQVVKADPLRDVFAKNPSNPPATWARLVYEELTQAQKRQRPYSAPSAAVGSTRTIPRIARSPATRPVAASVATTQANTSGSRGSTSYNTG
jgi:cyclase